MLKRPSTVTSCAKFVNASYKLNLAKRSKTSRRNEPAGLLIFEVEHMTAKASSWDEHSQSRSFLHLKQVDLKNKKETYLITICLGNQI